MATPSADAASAVRPSVVSAAEDTLAAAESVGDHLSQLLAAAEDPDAVAELPPLLRARAFLAVAQAATSLLAGTVGTSLSRCVRLAVFFNFLIKGIFLWIFAVRLRCSGIDPDEHPIRKEFVSSSYL